jgi:hypothetical protein
MASAPDYDGRSAATWASPSSSTLVFRLTNLLLYYARLNKRSGSKSEDRPLGPEDLNAA